MEERTKQVHQNRGGDHYLVSKFDDHLFLSSALLGQRSVSNETSREAVHQLIHCTCGCWYQGASNFLNN
jgi:hypothetical protein